ncbi:MAG: MFS transporter [Chloroflexota bacterium]
MPEAPQDGEQAPQARGLAGARWYPIAVIGLAVLSHGGFSLSGQGFTPFYPFIQDDLGLTRTQVGLITGTIFGAATVTSAGFGWAIDRFGVRFVSGGFMVLSGAFVSLLALTSSFLTVLLVAALMGSLRPVGHPAGTRAIMDWVGAKRRGTAMSIKQAGNPILAATAAAVVPPLAVAFGWRTAAVALGCFIAVGGCLIVVLYRDRPGAAAARKGGSLSFKEGMRRVMGNRDIALVVGFGFPLVGAQVATLTYFLLYLRDSLGVAVVVGGGLLAGLQASSFVMRIAWGVLSDTVGGGRRKPVLFVAATGAVAVLVLVAMLPAGTPVWALGLVAVALGATATSWVSVQNVLLAELCEPGQVGTTIGYASMVGRSAIVIAPPLFGLIADGVGYKAAWLALAGAIALGMGSLVPVRERGRGPV